MKPDLSFTLIDRLIPYARNSRTHSDEQVAQIAASIREFGFTKPGRRPMLPVRALSLENR